MLIINIFLFSIRRKQSPAKAQPNEAVPPTTDDTSFVPRNPERKDSAKPAGSESKHRKQKKKGNRKK